MASSPRYTLSRYQLTELMSQRGKDAAERVAEYGGVGAICDHLASDLKGGLSGDKADLDARKSEYGTNYVPPVRPKYFIELCLDAIEDKTLIILIIAALVSIVLGVTVEEQKVGEGGRECMVKERLSCSWQAWCLYLQLGRPRCTLEGQCLGVYYYLSLRDFPITFFVSCFVCILPTETSITISLWLK